MQAGWKYAQGLLVNIPINLTIIGPIVDFSIYM